MISRLSLLSGAFIAVFYLFVCVAGAQPATEEEAEAAESAPAVSPQADSSPSPTPTPSAGRSPAWAKEAVWYEIVVPRFRNGNPENDPTVDTLAPPIRPSSLWRVTPWTGDWYARAEWETELGGDFYEHGVTDRRFGGDLSGLIERLDYLQDLGVNALCVDALFPSRSPDAAASNSFHHIDPNLGPDPAGDQKLVSEETADPETWRWTAADKQFIELLKVARERGIRIIVDVSFSGTGRECFAFRDLRRNQAGSPYKEWYDVQEFDDPDTAENEFKYEGAAGVPAFARAEDDLNEGAKAYIFNAVRRWMDPDGNGKPFGVDGWRIDGAGELPTGFLKQLNEQVRSINPEAYTVADLRGEPAGLIENGGFSAATNYHGFAIPVRDFFIEGRLTADGFGEMLTARRGALSDEVAHGMQNLMDSGSTDRLASMIQNPSPEEGDPIPYDTANSPHWAASYDITKPTQRTRAIQRMIALMQMTYIGAPSIYYGTEAGMWGGDSPDNRMPMVWQDMTFSPQSLKPGGGNRPSDDVNFDEAIHGFYRQAIALRRDYRALNHGAIGVIETAGSRKAFAFARATVDQEVLVVFNRGDEAETIVLKLGEAAARYANPAMIFTTAALPEAVTFEIMPTGVAVTMPALTGVVIGAQ